MYFSRKERNILGQLAAGGSSRDIAAALELQVGTICKNLRAIQLKAGLPHRYALVLYVRNHPECLVRNGAAPAIAKV